MKKSLSVVLSFLLAFSCFCCLFTGSASAVGTSKWVELWQQGYENCIVGDNLKVSEENAKAGTFPSAEKPGLEWGINAAKGYFEKQSTDDKNHNYRPVNTMTVTAAQAAAGSNSLAITAGQFAFSTSLGNLTSNTNYRVSVKLKGYDGIATLTKPSIFVAKTLFVGNLANDGNKQKQSCLQNSSNKYALIENYTYKTDSFDTVTLEFNSADNTTAYFVLAFEGGGTGTAGNDLWVDDLSLSAWQTVENDDINQIGTFEGFDAGTSLKISEANAKAGTLPAVGEWGWNKIAGYFGQILSRETTLADGTTYTPDQPSGDFDYRHSGATMTVSTAHKRSGEKSLEVKNDGGAAVMGLKVAKNREYLLTYYCLVADKTVTFANHGIFSDLQVTSIVQGGIGAAGKDDEKSQRVAKGTAIDVTNHDWQKVELTFNSGILEKVYYVLSYNGPQTVYIDDLTLTDITATSFGDLENYRVGASVKVKDITQFPQNGEWGANANAGYFRATYDGVNYDKFNNANTVSASGSAADNAGATFKVVESGDGEHGKVLELTHLAWAANLGIAVEKNTNYTLRYDIKYKRGSKLNHNSYITTTVNTKDITNINQQYVLAVYDKSRFNDSTWTTATATFNSGNLEMVYLVMNDSSNTSSNTYYLDNITLTKLDDTAVATFGGNAIRTTGNPALRFTSTVNLDDLTAKTGGEVKEIGFAAIRSDYLGTAVLVKDGVYGAKKAVTGVAYQKDGTDNKILEQTGSSYTFRAALYNIGVNKNGSKFDYSILGKDFSVRPYVVLEHNNKTLETVYGETQSCSIFAVAEYLENSQAEHESEWAAVNSYLYADGQTADISGVASRAAAYEAWKQTKAGGLN